MKTKKKAERKDDIHENRLHFILMLFLANSKKKNEKIVAIAQRY